MLQLVKLDTIPDIVLQDGIDGLDRLSRETLECYAIARDSGEAICVIGIRPYTLLSMDGVMWAYWIDESKPTLGEFRHGKTLMDYYFTERGGKMLAEVEEGDAAGQKFVEWLDFKYVFSAHGFKIYVRE